MLEDDAIGPTQLHMLESAAVGDRFCIHTARCGPDPKATLVLSDADGLFGLAVDSIRMLQLPGLIPDLMVVGVGYEDATGYADTMEIRARDLTPTRHEFLPRSGGADAFLRFLRDELRPWLVALHPGAAADLTYFGHSLGGLFGTHVLLDAPDTFDRYILSSPSLWWDHREIFGRLDASTLADADRRQVYFGIGGEETDAGRRREAAYLADDHLLKPGTIILDMVEDLRQFVEQLDAIRPSDLEFRHRVFPDEFHATVPSLVLTHALRWMRPGAAHDVA